MTLAAQVAELNRLRTSEEGATEFAALAKFVLANDGKIYQVCIRAEGKNAHVSGHGLTPRALGILKHITIERAVAAFARSANGGLVVAASPQATDHRDLIITLAARHKLPAIYSDRFFVAAGGLISYGPNFDDEAKRAAGYVDRILKGEKPADLRSRLRQNSNQSKDS